VLAACSAYTHGSISMAILGRQLEALDGGKQAA
jgi:hypothetical protein